MAKVCDRKHQGMPRVRVLYRNALGQEETLIDAETGRAINYYRTDQRKGLGNKFRRWDDACSTAEKAAKPVQHLESLLFNSLEAGLTQTGALQWRIPIMWSRVVFHSSKNPING